jgi:hypothetical protein
MGINYCIQERDSVFLQLWNLSMKEGSLFALFCLYLWDPPNRDASDRILAFLVSLESSRGGGFRSHGVCLAM